MKAAAFSPAIALCGLIATSLFATPAIASVVLLINVSNPAHVTFNAVANNSANNGHIRADYDGGIALDNFFTSNQSILLANPLAITGNLTSIGTSRSFNEAVTFNYGNGTPVPGRDVSLYYNTTDTAAYQEFSTSAPPFTGSSWADLSAFAAGLPAHGATGSVLMSYSGGTTIGEWQVTAVPEPTEYMAFATAGMVGFVLWRRRNSKQECG